MNAILSFVRRLRPADLILPAGATLVSAGLQQLVDREHRQRRRLAALDELVHIHRGALAAGGVEISPDLARDESHPLDIDGVLEHILSRPATEDRPAEEAPRPRPRRALRRLAILGIAGAGGLLVWGRGYAKTYGQESTLSGFLTAWRGGPAQGPETESIAAWLDKSRDLPVDRCTTCQSVVSWNRGDQVWMHTEAYEQECHAVTMPAAVNEEAPRPVDDELEQVIGKGEPPFEECGWTGCDWTSDATRSPLSQSTAAAVHRNRCTFRPAGAVVRE